MYANFYRNAALFKHDYKNVVYIAHVGKYKNQDLFKYGKSTDVYQREYNAHRLNFESFNMLHIANTNYKDIVETTFERELKIRDVHVSLEIKNKRQTELFITNDTYSFDYFKCLLSDIIDHFDILDSEMRKLKMEEIKLQQMKIALEMKKLESRL